MGGESLTPMRHACRTLALLLLAVAGHALADDLPLRSATATRYVSLAERGTNERSWADSCSVGSFGGAPDDTAHAMLQGSVAACWDAQALAIRVSLVGRMRQAARAFEGERLLVVLDPNCSQGACLVLEVPFGGTPVARVASGPAGAFATADARIESRADSREWVVSATVPWGALKLDPSARRAIGFDVVRIARDGRALRWSPIGGAADADPRAVGLLLLGRPQLTVERVAWPEMTLEPSWASLTVRNTSAEPLSGTAVVLAEGPLHLPRESRAAFSLAAGEAKDMRLPLTPGGPGRIGLRFRLLDAEGATLVELRRLADVAPRFRVGGIGWLEATLERRLVGEHPVSLRLRALDCLPTPNSQPPVELNVRLIGPAGPLSLGGRSADLDLSALDLAVVDREIRFETRDLLPGSWMIVVEVTREGRTLGRAELDVRLAKELEKDLGFAKADAALADCRRRYASDVVRRGSATLEQRVLRAEKLLATSTAASEDEFAATADAIRAELAEAAVVAADLAAGRRPYAGKAGTFYLAHTSPVDGSPQPYALYVPETYADQRPAAIVLELHGWDGSNSGFGFPGGDNSLKQEAKKRGWLVLYPWGRGNQDWRDSGDVDLFALLDELAVLYSIDRDRLYLTGISMGGRGVWHLAARHPDAWAGIVPIAGASSGQVWSIWQEERLSPNFRNLPAYIVHGGVDGIVPVEDARTMWRRMQDEGSDVRYQEFATRGHEGFGDFAPTLFGWMDTLRRDPWPASVRYDTDWLRWGGAYWLRIEGLEREGLLGSIEARVVNPSRVAVRAERVTRFALHLGGHPLLDRTKPVEVAVEGETVFSGRVGPDAWLAWERTPAGWRRASDDPEAHAKGPLVSGPMRRVFGDRFRMVYGTQGWDDGSVLASYDMARRSADRWEWWMWGRMRPLADREADDADLADGGLLLYGGAEVNALSRRQLEQWPSPLPSSDAWKLARPSVWNPAYLATVFSAPSGGALRAVGDLGEVWPLPPTPMAAQDSDYESARIDEEGRLIADLEGVSPADWSVPTSEEEGILLASDARWRATRLAEGDWPSLGYDDTAWGRPTVRLRKLFDESCWHNAALHKYGRLVESFLPPAMALSAPAESERPSLSDGASYFRGSFELDRVPPTAWLRVYLDDEGEVWLNGEPLLALSARDLIRDADVSPLLRPGRNVLAVRLLNTEYDQCLCLQITDKEPAHAAP